MTIGSGIALIVIGAILYFAVEFEIAGIDINAIGVICMVGGLIALILGMIAAAGTGSRRRVVERRPATEERDVI